TRSSWPPALTGSRTRKRRQSPKPRARPQQRRPPMRNPRNEPLADLDIGEARGTGDGPERRCVLTGAHGGRDALLRLAVSPDGEVLPDALARAPGRGAWVGVDREALAEALASGKLKAALARAF